MGSNYLQGVTEGFGLPSSLPAGLGQIASTLVDSYLHRPEGLIYQSDTNGNPCAMTALMPSFTYTSTAAISPGTGVTVTVTPPLVRADLLGEVLVLDHSNPALVEACVVISTNGNNQITLGDVQFSHTGPNVKMDVGRVISEDRSVPSKRPVVRVAKFPIVNILSLLGRYSFGRRSDQIAGRFQEANLLASLQAFGGPPPWIPVLIPQSSWDVYGEIWVPASLYMAYFSDVRVKYVAGFPNVPDPVVRATAQIAVGLAQTTNFNGGLKSITAGSTTLSRFAATSLDDDVKKLLDPFCARRTF